MSDQGRFLTGPTMGHVLWMTATGAFGITFVFLVDAANLFWISQLEDPQLVAAIGFAYAIQFFSISVGVGLMIATTAMVSRTIGQGRHADARRQAGALTAIALLVQIAVALAIFLARHDLAVLAGATGTTADLAARYLGLTIFSLIPMSVYFSASGILRAHGFGTEAMYVTLWSGGFLMLADPPLILWLGLDGAALGVVIFRVLMMGLALFFALRQKDLIAQPQIALARRLLWPFTLLALPIIATQLATPAGNYLLTRVMSQFGDNAVAAWAVVGRLTVVAFGGLFALSGAIGGIFGQNFGAGLMARVHSTYRDALVFCLGYTLVAWALFVVGADWFVWAFGLQGRGAEVLRAFAFVGVGGFVFMGALYVSNAAFNTLGHPLRATALNWLTHGALSWPLAVWLAGISGATGVIYGQAAATVIVGGFAALWGWRFTRGLNAAP